MAAKKATQAGGYLDRAQRLALYRKLNEAHGDGTVAVAAQGRRFQLDRFSTGSLALDFATGGGIPAERMTMLIGQESSGKTTLAMRIAADAQRRCANCLRYVPDLEVVHVEDAATGEDTWVAQGTCDCYRAGLWAPRMADGEKEADFKVRVERYKDNSFEELVVAYVDVEHALDQEWAETVGVDRRRLVHVLPQKAEQAVDVYCDLLFTGMVDLLILDSLAAMAPQDEIQASAEDAQQGLAARIINKFVRRANAGSVGVQLGSGRGRTPTQVWINQVRQKIGAYGEGFVTPGGMGQRFAASLRVKLWAANWERGMLLAGEGAVPKDEQISMGKHVDICFKVEKNKTGPAQGEGRFTQWVTGPRKGQIDEWRFLVHLAERYRVLRPNEKKTRWFLGDREYAKKQEALDELARPDAAAACRAALLKKLYEERDGGEA